MQLKISTDYALRVVMYTAVADGIVTSKELSEKLGIPQSLVFKTCKKLSNHGIIKITTGVQGGFLLQKPPEEISVYEILVLFEPTMQINRCLEEDRYCSRCATQVCALRKMYGKLQKKMEDELKNTSVKDLLEL